MAYEIVHTEYHIVPATNHRKKVYTLINNTVKENFNRIQKAWKDCSIEFKIDRAGDGDRIIFFFVKKPLFFEPEE